MWSNFVSSLVPEITLAKKGVSLNIFQLSFRNKVVGATRATWRWRSGGQNAQWMYRLYFCHYVPLSTLIVLNERRHTTENYFKKTTFSCLSVECESRIPQLDSSSHIMWHNLARWKYSEEVRYLPRNFRCSEINKIIIFRWKTLEKIWI